MFASTGSFPHLDARYLAYWTTEAPANRQASAGIGDKRLIPVGIKLIVPLVVAHGRLDSQTGLAARKVVFAEGSQNVVTICSHWCLPYTVP